MKKKFPHLSLVQLVLVTFLAGVFVEGFYHDPQSLFEGSFFHPGTLGKGRQGAESELRPPLLEEGCPPMEEGGAGGTATMGPTSSILSLEVLFQPEKWLVSLLP